MNYPVVKLLHISDMVGVVLISEFFGELLDTLGNAGFLVELLIHHINVRNIVDRLVLVIVEVGS